LRETENSAIEGEPKRKKVKLTDLKQTQDGRKSSKEDRLEEFTRIMSKKRVKKADWAADVGAEVGESNPTSKPNAESEANQQSSSQAYGADPDDASMRGDIEGGISDAEWMRRKMGGVELEEKVFEQSEDEDELSKRETNQVYSHCAFQYHYLILKPCQTQPVGVQERYSVHEAIRSTGRLFVRNLVFSCTEDELRPRFEEYGPVDQVSLRLVPRTGLSGHSRMINSIGTTDS
jgi:multiple RNA-binding domain-containing protein 1